MTEIIKSLESDLTTTEQSTFEEYKLLFHRLQIYKDILDTYKGYVKESEFDSDLRASYPKSQIY